MGPLPILGQKKIVEGKELDHTIPPFFFHNQDSVAVNNEVLSDYIYLADYFFTSCPSICPKVKKQVLRVYEEFKDEEMLKFVSITMDPKRDDVAALKTYATNLGVDHNKWWFLTGDKEATLNLSSSFFIVAYEDASVPGGFDHSGKIILVDKSGKVRAFAEGTDPEDVDKIFNKIRRLINEYKT